MSHHRITHHELLQAELALLAAVLLQLFTRHVGSDLLPGSQYLIIFTEIVLAVLLGITINFRHPHIRHAHHVISILLLGLISAANITGLIYVLNSLIVGHTAVDGETLLVTSLAIFLTNIIVYALWYWEVDSPGLTRTRWSRTDRDFQFVQHDRPEQFAGWQPQFGDFLFLSITNALSFAPSDARPLTLQAKALMASQSMISMFTLALVIARAISILGT